MNAVKHWSHKSLFVKVFYSGYLSKRWLCLFQNVLKNFDDIVVTVGSGGSASGIAIGNYLTGSKLKWALNKNIDIFFLDCVGGLDKKKFGSRSWHIDLSLTNLFIMTRSQIFSSLACPHLVIKDFVIWPALFVFFSSCCLHLRRPAYTELCNHLWHHCHHCFSSSKGFDFVKCFH